MYDDKKVLSFDLHIEFVDKKRVLIFFFNARCRKPGTSHVHIDNIGQITHLNTQGQSRSKADSKAQNRYQTIVPNCGNDHCYDPIHKSEQESGPKFVIVQ